MRIEAILAAARCPRVYTHTRSPIAFLWNEFAAAQLYSSCLHIWHYVIACFSCFRPITKYSFQFTLSTKKYVISHTSIRLMWCCASAKWIALNVITASQPNVAASIPFHCSIPPTQNATHAEIRANEMSAGPAASAQNCSLARLQSWECISELYIIL